MNSTSYPSRAVAFPATVAARAEVTPVEGDRSRLWPVFLGALLLQAATLAGLLLFSFNHS